MVKVRSLLAAAMFLFVGTACTEVKPPVPPWADTTIKADVDESVGTEPKIQRSGGPVLSWESKSGGWLQFQPAALPGAKGLDFSICYTTPRPAKLQLTILNGAREAITRLYLFPDGQGWRHVEMSFTEDGVLVNETQDKNPVSLLLQVVDGPPCTVYVGKPRWLAKAGHRRTPDLHCPSIYGSRTETYPSYMKEWLRAFKNPEKTGSGPISTDLDLIAKNYDQWVLGSGPISGDVGLAIAFGQKEWIHNALQKVEKLGLRREGQWIFSAGNKEPKTNDILFLLTPLALEWRRTHEAKLLKKIWLLLDYLEQQGFGACNPGDPTADRLPFIRLKLAGYAHAVALLREPMIQNGRAAVARRNLRWLARVGEWDGNERYDINADVLRGEALPRFVYCLLTPDPAVRSWELGRFSAWLSDCLVVTPNLRGFMKPDFTVYHHHNPYLVEYGPHALLAAATLATWLDGTQWSLSADTKEGLESCGDALLDLSYGFSVPIGTRGRFPGQTRSMTENLPLYLTLSSRPTFSGRHQASARALMEAMGKAEVAELLTQKSVKQSLIWMNSLGIEQYVAPASGSTTMAAPRIEFRAFNWAGVAAFKKESWGAFVSGFSKWIFDYEAGNPPNIENDWGRYLRYGTVELGSATNSYNDLAAGWTINAGWDWSLIPGATTLLMPAQKLAIGAPPSSRKHRNFSDSKFCAGLAGPDGCGVFGLDLHDRAFPGKLRARKSVFMAGDSLLCLGSGISSTLADVEVVTTLFQFGRGGVATGQPTTKPVEVGGAGHTPAVFTDPAGNTFEVLNGGSLFRRQGIQSGPDPTGNISSGDYDTVWIDHGAQPAGAGYAFVIYPSTGAKPALRPHFDIVERSASAHIVRYPALGLTAHVLFKPRTMSGALGADRPCLIWEKAEGADRKEITLCDPDLNFENGAGIDDVSTETATPTTVKLSVPGRWQLAAPSTAAVAEAKGENTMVTVTCCAGAAVVVPLVREALAQPQHHAGPLPGIAPGMRAGSVR
jgi:hypothetical protein